MKWKEFVAAVCVMSGLGSIAAPGAVAQESTMKIEPVVVTATKTEKSPEDVTQSVTVVTAEEIKKTGALTVGEALQHTAGLNINNYGPVGALNQANIRGSSSAQVLVLLDGKRLNSPRDAGFDLSKLPVSLDEIERIEVVRGASSALYGADAMGGVVNIITRKPMTTATRIAGSAGSHGYDTLSGGFSGRRGQTYYTISGERQTYDGFRQNSDLRQGTFNGKLGYDFSKSSSLELTGNYVGKKSGVPGSLAFPSATARQLERETIYGASYREKLGQSLDIILSGRRIEDTLKFRDPNPVSNTDSRHESRADGGEAQVNWLANSWNLFTVGYETRRDTVDSTDSGNHATSLEAAYIQDEISIGEPLILVVGTRIDDHSVYGEKGSPRASARYKFRNAGTILRASAGKAFRAPTFNDLFWSDNFLNRGNELLKPESSKEYEGGIEHPLGGGAVVKATGFQRKVRDLIIWQEYDPINVPFAFQPENIGKARIRGYEIEALFKVSPDASLAANYTYLNPVDELTGEKIYYAFPKSQAKGVLTISVDAETYLSLEGRSVENYVRPGEAPWRYTVADGKIGQAIGRKGERQGEIFFGMKNLFDRKYQTVRGYPMPPKEIFGGLSLLF